MRERDLAAGQGAQQLRDLRIVQPMQAAAGLVHADHQLEQWRQGWRDAPSPVVERGGHSVGERAALAQASAQQAPLEAAAVAKEAASDPGAVAADRCPVMTSPGQQPRQIAPSQFAALPARRPHRTQSRMCQRS